MAKGFFVTGTDTDAGKTFFSVALLEAMKQQGLTTLAMKPVAAGCEAGQNDDALQLRAAMTADLSYQHVNPIALGSAIAPHVAAEQEGKRVLADRLVGSAKGLMTHSEQYCLIEGAGGWLCPLNNKESLADFVIAMNIPVVLVVGMKLGCLNHAMLTAAAIRQAGLPLLGWVANTIDSGMPVKDENIAYLEQAIAAPCIANLPQCESPQAAADYIDLSFLKAI